MQNYTQARNSAIQRNTVTARTKAKKEEQQRRHQEAIKRKELNQANLVAKTEKKRNELIKQYKQLEAKKAKLEMNMKLLKEKIDKQEYFIRNNKRS